MPLAYFDDLRLHYADQGNPTGPPLVLAHALGTDLTLWDDLLPLLPPGLRLIRVDMRGHGLSDTPSAPYTMGALVRDAERVLDHLQVRAAVFLGPSIGGMIAQGLAVKRPDLVRGLVLSNTAAKIGTPALWQDRIATVRAGGLVALADAMMERWFAPAFRANPGFAAHRARFLNQRAEGWIGCAHAISGTDFYSTTATLSLPTLVIAGSEDGSTPPDLVRETAELIRGSRFVLIRRAGHLPFVEQPQTYADALTAFLTEIAHR